MAIIALTELIRNSLDKNETAAGIFVDLQKAFDTVEHSILLKKLDHYGVRGVANDLFKSYLQDRYHCVKIENTYSDYTVIKHGVPQGSVLGPLLFLIYINDLRNAIKHSNTIHFADDTSLLCQGKSLNKINKHVNHDLTQLVSWLRANKISLNAAKTEIIIFRTKNSAIQKSLNFRLSGQRVQLSKKVKYLGIDIDEHLNWSSHIAVLLNKLSRATGILAKLRHYVNYHTILSIYYALFDSHVNYSLQSWGHVPNESLDKISKLQNKAMRIIHYKTNRDSVAPLYLQSRILPTHLQLKVKNCLFAFDQQRNNLPPYFRNFCKQMGTQHEHFTKSSKNKLEISRTNTVKYGTYNISNLIAKHWNEIIPQLKIDLEKISKSTLKRNIQSFLLYDYV